MADAVDITWQDHGAVGRVARVTMHFSGRLNIVNTPALESFIPAMKGLSGEADLRAVVLRGADEAAFIGGADIKEMVGLDRDSAEEFISRLHTACSMLRDMPVPVIADIRGFCLGAGLEVAAACDLRVAAEYSVFGMPEVHVGIPSVIEAALLPGLIGWGRTRELLFTGRRIGATEAASWGLIERAAPADAVEGIVSEWLDGILRAGRRAIRLQKRLIRQWEDKPLGEAIKLGIACFRDAYTTDEPAIFMRRFLDRKKS